MVLIKQLEATFCLPQASGAMGFDVFDRAADSALDLLRSAFDLQDGERHQEETFFLETFDWRLHRKDFLLSASKVPGGYGLSLNRPGGERPLRASSAKLPGFAGDLPGIFRSQLARPMAMRRLLPILGVRQQVKEAKLLDTEGKTVARLRVEQAEVIAGGEALSGKRPGGKILGLLPSLLRVRSVVGYDAEYRSLVDHMKKRLRWEWFEGSIFEAALSLAKRTPRDYSSKVRIPLESAGTALAAARSIHLTLLEALKANESGTRVDLDSEFLHDFRVAVRRTRSALTQIKGIFQPTDLERFRQDFAWLGSCTGPTRDLDVFLLKFNDLQASLPETVGRDLEPLRGFLEKAQQREQKRLAQALDSDRYRDLLRVWHGFLSGPVPDEQEDCPNANRLAIDVARERIWKIYRRIVKKGRTVEPDTPVEILHEIRIDGKKLRYLLEFFSGFFSGDEIMAPIRALKGLQDNLGDLNDYEVQSLRLEDFAREIFAEGDTPVETFLAMGRLTYRLDEGKLEEKRKFTERFAKFDSPKNRGLYRALFRPSS